MKPDSVSTNYASRSMTYLRETCSPKVQGWLTAALLPLVLAISGCGDNTPQDQASTATTVTMPSNAPVAFVHLFEWTWPDIAMECENFLGPKGYTAVQISPPNEHIDHRHPDIGVQYAWWARYQPVTYQLVSRSGNEQEFVDMVNRCAAAGVKIYADAVINHMAHQTDTGINGSKFSHARKEYPPFSSEHFNPTCTIPGEAYELSDDPNINAERAELVRRCQLGDLSDLDMGNETVQSTVAGYLQNLVDKGVAGFRIDASKHMHPEHIQAIMERLNGDFYVFQEVIDAGPAPVTSADYTPIADVTEFKYSLHIGQIFSRKSLTELENFGIKEGFMDSGHAVVFIDNHDNQRGHGMAAEMSHRSGKVYELANIFMLAWPYGYPKVMSSYEWGGEDDSRGPPHDGNGNTSNVYNDDGSMNCFADAWKCEHRLPAVANMIEFRAAMQQANAFEVSNWWSDDDQLAFTRGNSDGGVGFIVLNRSDESLNQTFQTGLPAGTYCNITNPEFDPSATGCGGEQITVDDNGKAEVSLSGVAGLAIHIGAQANNQ